MANDVDIIGNIQIPFNERPIADKYLKNYSFDKEYPLPNIVRFPAFEHRRFNFVSYPLVGMIVDEDSPNTFYNAFLKMISGLKSGSGEIYLNSASPYVRKIVFWCYVDEKDWHFKAEDMILKEIRTDYFPKVISLR